MAFFGNRGVQSEDDVRHQYGDVSLPFFFGHIYIDKIVRNKSNGKTRVLFQDFIIFEKSTGLR